MKTNCFEAMDEKLQSADKLNLFNDWMYEQVSPFLKGDILEVGSGRGTYSKKLVKDFPHSKIYLSDIDEDYIRILKHDFNYSNIYVNKLDLGKNEDFDNLDIRIDSALALNVLEHVEDDVRALKNIYKKLKPGGIFVILVPAHEFLFNTMDKNIGHYRRYNKKILLEKISKTDFSVKSIFYFNFLSIFGWYWTGKILKKTIINENALGFFNKLVPFLRFFEKYFLRRKVGISLIAILEKH